MATSKNRNTRRQKRQPAVIDGEAQAKKPATPKSAATKPADSKSASASSSAKSSVPKFGRSDAKTGEERPAESPANAAKDLKAEQTSAEAENKPNAKEASRDIAGDGGTGAGAAPPGAAAGKETKRRQGAPVMTAVISALVGGGVAFGGYYLLDRFGGGGQVSSEISTLQQQIAQLRENQSATGEDIIDPAQLTALAERLGALEAVMPTGAGSIETETLRAELASANAAAQAAQESVEALAGQIEEMQSAIVAAESGGGEAGAAVSAALSGISERVDGVEALVDGTASELRAGLQAVSGKVESLESEAATGASSTVVSRLDSVAAAQESLSSKVDEIGTRLSALETAVNSDVLPAMDEVRGAAEAAASGQRVARSVSARSLATALEQGGAFATELAAAETLIGQTQEIGELRALAQTGIATPAQLAARFEPVSKAILSAQALPSENVGLMDRLMSSAQSLVTVKPAGPIEGDSPAAILSRVEDALMKGESEMALNEWQSLPEDAKAMGADWAVALQNRVQAEKLIGAVVGQLTAS